MFDTWELTDISIYLQPGNSQLEMGTRKAAKNTCELALNIFLGFPTARFLAGISCWPEELQTSQDSQAARNTEWNQL